MDTSIERTDLMFDYTEKGEGFQYLNWHLIQYYRWNYFIILSQKLTIDLWILTHYILVD